MGMVALSDALSDAYAQPIASTTLTSGVWHMGCLWRLLSDLRKWHPDADARGQLLPLFRVTVVQSGCLPSRL